MKVSKPFKLGIINFAMSRFRMLNLNILYSAHVLFVYFIKLLTNLSNPVMFRKPVVVKNGKHQGLVECVSIGKILELERFVEEGI